MTSRFGDNCSSNFLSERCVVKRAESNDRHFFLAGFNDFLHWPEQELRDPWASVELLVIQGYFDFPGRFQRTGDHLENPLLT